MNLRSRLLVWSYLTTHPVQHQAFRCPNDSSWETRPAALKIRRNPCQEMSRVPREINLRDPWLVWCNPTWIGWFGLVSVTPTLPISQQWLFWCALSVDPENRKWTVEPWNLLGFKAGFGKIPTKKCALQCISLTGMNWTGMEFFVPAFKKRSPSWCLSTFAQ